MWARLADFHVLLLHLVYGGNTNDAKQFVKYRVDQKAISRLPRTVLGKTILFTENHVWSVETTMVLCWELWPIHIFVVIDHFSRKVMSV